MTNLQKIEIFLRSILISHGKDPLNPEEKVTIKLQSLMEVMKDMAHRIGDEKINDFFKNVLSSMVLEAPDGKLKDLYMKTLNEFNKELNVKLN